MKRGITAIGLHKPKTPANTGHVLRAMQSFCGDLLCIDPRGSGIDVGSTDANGWINHVPVITGPVYDLTPHACRPIAVEICEGATPLPDFDHPEKAYYIFGPEDGDVPTDIIGRCCKKIQIPSEFCLNLAMSVNVVLSDRYNQLYRK